MDGLLKSGTILTSESGNKYVVNVSVQTITQVQ